jgi:hypothetical protein
LSDDNDSHEDPLDVEHGESDSPGDEESDSEHPARDEPSEQRLSDDWSTSQHIQHSPEPWSPALSPQSQFIEPTPTSPKVPVDDLPILAPTNKGTDNHLFILDTYRQEVESKRLACNLGGMHMW